MTLKELYDDTIAEIVRAFGENAIRCYGHGNGGKFHVIELQIPFTLCGVTVDGRLKLHDGRCTWEVINDKVNAGLIWDLSDVPLCAYYTKAISDTLPNGSNDWLEPYIKMVADILLTNVVVSELPKKVEPKEEPKEEPMKDKGLAYRGNNARVEERAIIGKNVSVDYDASVSSESQLDDGVYIGTGTGLYSRVVVGFGTRIYGGTNIYGTTTIGSRCHIGYQVRITESEIGRDVYIGDYASVDKVKIADNVFIPRFAQISFDVKSDDDFKFFLFWDGSDEKHVTVATKVDRVHDGSFCGTRQKFLDKVTVEYGTTFGVYKEVVAYIKELK